MVTNWSYKESLKQNDDWFDCLQDSSAFVGHESCMLKQITFGFLNSGNVLCITSKNVGLAWFSLSVNIKLNKFENTIIFTAKNTAIR